MRKIQILVALILFPLYFYGWGKEGHKIVADIAKTKLQKGVAKQVKKYLADDSFEQAALWMDEIKSDHTNDYMRQWHYVNIELNEAYQKADGGDIVSELKIVINELKNYRKLEKEQVNKDLKILFHLCGDITQPLHVGYGDDKGGNDVKLKYNKCHSNLHQIWDSDIIQSENITTELCLSVAEKWADKEAYENEKIDVLKWMNDSRISLFSAYNIKNKKIAQEYIDINKNIIEIQLIKGGYRLAAVLNEIFKN